MELDAPKSIVLVFIPIKFSLWFHLLLLYIALIITIEVIKLCTLDNIVIVNFFSGQIPHRNIWHMTMNQYSYRATSHSLFHLPKFEIDKVK